MSITMLPQPAFADLGAEQPPRAVHFVGSLPPELCSNERAVMLWFLKQAEQAQILTLPCDRDPNWIVQWLQRLALVPALHPVRVGDCSTYSELPVYRLIPTQYLTAGDLSLQRLQDVRTAMSTRQDVAPALPPHQVSIPHPLDLVLSCFRKVRQIFQQWAVFRDAVLLDVIGIHDRWGHDVVFQLETVAVMAMFHRTPRPFWPTLAGGLARQAANLISSIPSAARWILHLCYGDLAHQPLFEPVDLSPVVQFCNALQRCLSSRGFPMPPVHIPMCTGISAPPTEPSFYRPLRYLHHDVDVIAGLVDEIHPEDSGLALRLAETELGGRVLAVAAACGHGRRTATAARYNALLATTLAHTSNPDQIP